ncbi:MAG: transporter substrate-binding domain-containing protein, partial [Paramuribaculum sp.]
MIRYCHIPLFVILALSAIVAGGCGGGNTATSADSASAAEPRRQLPDTLRVGTLYSPTSYFIYRETEMGYDYDLARRFASDKGMEMQIVVANNLARAVEMLDSGIIDLLAYEVPVTAEYRERVVACGVENITHQVLVL